MATEEPVPFLKPSARSAVAKQSARDEHGDDIMIIHDFLSSMFRQLQDNLDNQHKCTLEFLIKRKPSGTFSYETPHAHEELKISRSSIPRSKNKVSTSKAEMWTRRQSTLQDFTEVASTRSSSPMDRVSSNKTVLSDCWSWHDKKHPNANEPYEILDTWEELKVKDSCQMSCVPEDAAAAGSRNSFFAIFPRRLARVSSNGNTLRSCHFGTVLESTSFARHFVLQPYGNPRMIADFCSVIFVLWDTVMIPLSFFEIPESPFLICMAWATRLFWTVDILLSFLSGYALRDGSVELRAKFIAKRYIWTWFALDVSVVSIDWLDVLFSASWSGYGVTRMTRASRAYRVIRFARLLRLVRMREKVGGLIERFISEGVVTLLEVMKLIVMMLAGGHFMACLWYAVAVSDSSKNWVKVHGFAGKPLYLRYTMSLRWALSQFSGGMDEVQPENASEQVYAAFVFILSYWSGAVFVSCLTSSITQMYLREFQQSSQLMALRRFLSQNGISRELELRVYRNAQNAHVEYQRHMPESDVVLLQKVSPQMFEEIHCEMYTPALVHHPFWKRSTVESPPVMRRVCHCAMSQLSVFEEDVIFNIGEAPLEPKAFIVHQGHLDYTSYEGSTAVCAEWQWISEASLWTSWVHHGVLRSRQDSHLYAIDAQTLQEVIMQFRSTAGSRLYFYARHFVTYLNEAKQDGSLVDDLVSGVTHPIEHVRMKNPELRPAQSTDTIGECNKAPKSFKDSRIVVGASSAKMGPDSESADRAERHPIPGRSHSQSISFDKSRGEYEEGLVSHAGHEEDRFSL